MALTITIEGKGVIATGDAISDSSGGTWAELGAGSISLSTETYLVGSTCPAGAYSNKAGWHYYDIGSGNELDFTASTGTEAGQFIYMPIMNPTPGLNETTANDGLRIRIGSSTSDYREFMILSGDDFNGWYGRWKTFVIDPTQSGSWADTGTFDISSVRYFGIYVDAVALAKGDNIFIDQISVGTGLRITGTSTTGWKDVVDYCTDYPNRAWGMMEERGGIYYCKGKIYIGDSTQTAVTSFSDSNRIIQWENTEYWDDTGSSWISSLPTDAYGIVVEDAASYTTTFNDGVVVGSDNGRSGTTFIGNSQQNVTIDLYGGNNTSSVSTLYGTKFQGITGGITSGNDGDHKFYGVTFVGCAQFDPVGAPPIRNCIFAETADVDAALLWNENIDIQDCNFIANSTGAAIEMPSSAGTPYSYVQLYFSGNTYDVLNSSGSAITINKAGTPASDPSTYEGTTVTFQGSVTITITVKDVYGAVIQNAQTGIYLLSDGTELLNTDTNASGVASTTYSGSTPADVKVWIRKASAGATRYRNYSSVQTVSSSGLTLSVTMTIDPNNNATT